MKSSPMRRWLRSILFIVLLVALTAGGYAGFHWHTANSHLRQAKVALDRFDYETAHAEVLRCFPYYSNDPDVALLAARISRRADAIGDARRFLDSLEPLRNQPSKLADEIRLENLLLDAQSGKGSDFSYQSLWELCKSDAANRELILEAMFRGMYVTHRFHRALEIITEWLSSNPADPRAYYWYGLLLDKKNPRGPEAASAFAQALARNPDHMESRLALAQLLLDSFDAGKAEPHFQYVLTQRPASIVAKIGLARCRAAVGEFHPAETQLRAVLATEPENPLALRELGIVLMQLGKLEEALDHLQHAESLWPHDLSTCYNLQQALHRLGRELAAQQQLEKHQLLDQRLRQLRKLLYVDLQKNPNDLVVLHNLGKVALQIGGPEMEPQGLAWLHRALQIDARHKETYALLADYYQSRNNHEMAQRCRRLAQ